MARTVPASLLGAAVASLALAGPATAAQPFPGARYTGHSAQGRVVDLPVPARGGRIQFYGFSGLFRCNLPGAQNVRFAFGVGSRHRPPTIVLRRDGSFAITIQRSYRLQAGLRAVGPGGTLTMTLTGGFDPPGPVVRGMISQRARGTLRGRFAARGNLRCDSGVVRWTATTSFFAPRSEP
jgi:hypothetical protein